MNLLQPVTNLLVLETLNKTHHATKKKAGSRLCLERESRKILANWTSQFVLSARNAYLLQCWRNLSATKPNPMGESGRHWEENILFHKKLLPHNHTESHNY